MKINVQKILDKYGQKNTFYTQQALKEIVEAVVDKCAEEALLLLTTEEGDSTNSCYKPCYNVKKLLEINPDRQSILNVKDQIKL